MPRTTFPVKPMKGTGSVTGRVRVIGVNALLAKFRAVSSYTALRTGHTVYELATIVHTRARELVPTDTGNLQSGIQIVKAGPYDWAVTASSLDGEDPEGKGKNQKEYANFVEFGRRRMAPRPFMRPAFAFAATLAKPKMDSLAREIERKFMGVAF